MSARAGFTERTMVTRDVKTTQRDAYNQPIASKATIIHNALPCRLVYTREVHRDVDGKFVYRNVQELLVSLDADVQPSDTVIDVHSRSGQTTHHLGNTTITVDSPKRLLDGPMQVSGIIPNRTYKRLRLEAYT